MKFPEFPQDLPEKDPGRSWNTTDFVLNDDLAVSPRAALRFELVSIVFGSEQTAWEDDDGLLKTLRLLDEWINS